jgi:hypothetical protein
MIYDIIIIGAGIAGLYTAYLIRKTRPNLKVLILEKNEKRIGGRMGTELFYGSNVSMGAGIGRFKKDKLLMSLLNELDVPYKKFETNTGESLDLQGKCNVKKLFLMIKKTYNEQRKKGIIIHKTFKEFAKPLLGESGYINFLACSGYTDYENSDIYDVLYNYGFEDNYDNFTGVGIPWNLLLSKLVEKIKPIKIKKNNLVYNFYKNEDDNFIVESRVTKKTKGVKSAKDEKVEKDVTFVTFVKYISKKIVFAANKDVLYPLIKNNKNSIYEQLFNQIQGQPFLRIYGKFSKSSIPILKKYITSPTMVVKGPLHKVISINPDNGVYMIVYTDNKSANYLYPYIKNNKKNRKFLCTLFEETFSIPKKSLELNDIVSFWWPVGTHYYLPLTRPYKNRIDFIKAAQNPEKGVFVVGEMVALHQGWVEGALESVKNIEKNLLK